MRETHTPHDLERLTQLVEEKCNGVFGPDESEELHALLAGSAELRRVYWDMIEFHIDLHWLLADKDSSEARPETLLSISNVVDDHQSIRRGGRTHRARFGSPGKWALAASLLIVAGVMGIVWSSGDSDQAPPAVASKTGTLPETQQRDAHAQPEPSARLADGAPVDARLASLVDKSVWRTGRPGDHNPSTLRYGDTVWADTGVIELRLDTGAVGVLRAPVALQLVSEDRVRLLHGRVTFTAPELTNGFTVETPAAEVVDLGTVFSVESSEEGTDLVVYGGKVDLRIPADGVADAPAAHDSVQLVTGEAVHVNREGTVSRVMSVQSSGDPMDPDDASRFAVIASVVDNNERKDHWSFYQIVVGGMREDAPAYVDRFHEWNGVTPDGMPPYLVGGDYVRVFNEDKAEQDLRIDVTLAEPATLYVLLDNRVAAPAWLAAYFTKTGDVIGVDETPHDTANRFPANDEFAQVGAGESIDRVHTVWKKIMPNGGEVTLGPNGMLLSREGHDPRPHYIRANMYGVVAVPMQKRELRSETP